MPVNDCPVNDCPVSDWPVRELRFRPREEQRPVSALLVRPENARAVVVLSHGAGAGMHHVFMEDLAKRLAGCGLATLRYQFPYMEQGSRRPDSAPLLKSTVRAAVACAVAEAPDVPLFVGGKSMGGRMSSMALAEESIEAVRGVVFFGFPLHPAGRENTQRADHLAEVEVPMCFLQGTRDKLADLDLLRPVCEGLGDLATLHIVDGADHGFHVLKRSGRTDDEVLDELAERAAAWVDGILGASP